MINTEEFTKRLHQVMEHYELSAASFADKIDVGRSSISHLLSGRNKPSLDFVLKITHAFPEIELYWLLNGKGSFPSERNQGPGTPSPLPSPPSQQDLFSGVSIGTSDNKRVHKDGKKEIQRIVIFYSDGTFDAYEA